MISHRQAVTLLPVLSCAHTDFLARRGVAAAPRKPCVPAAITDSSGRTDADRQPSGQGRMAAGFAATLAGLARAFVVIPPN